MLKNRKKKKKLGSLIDSKGELEYYLYPKFELTQSQKEIDTNIMIIGGTGVGKSTWINALLNYIQDIEIEEDIRYLLFIEKEMKEKYEKIYGKKPKEGSVTDEPDIYNIKSNKLNYHPIRIIDTADFDDRRGRDYDEKINNDILKLFENFEIENLSAVCLILKTTENMAHDRFKYILSKLFSLFGEDIKNNIIIILTFVDSFNDDELPVINTLKDQTSLFSKILGDFDNLTHFSFNNNAYFTDNRNIFKDAYKNNTTNFENFLNHVFSLESISLKSTKEVINSRIQMKTSINNLFNSLDYIINDAKSVINNKRNILEKQNRLEILKNKVYPNENYYYGYFYNRKNREKIEDDLLKISLNNEIKINKDRADALNKKYIII